MVIVFAIIGMLSMALIIIGIISIGLFIYDKVKGIDNLDGPEFLKKYGPKLGEFYLEFLAVMIFLYLMGWL